MLWLLFDLTDVRECDTNNGGCDHVCTEQEGSFQCACNDGYDLQPDARSCVCKYCSPTLPAPLPPVPRISSPMPGPVYVSIAPCSLLSAPPVSASCSHASCSLCPTPCSPLPSPQLLGASLFLYLLTTKLVGYMFGSVRLSVCLQALSLLNRLSFGMRVDLDLG